VDDLGRELDSLTSAATRGVVVPPPDEVRRRARQARRQGIGAGLASLAVVAIAVVALLPRGDAPAPQVPVGQPSTSAPSATSTGSRATPVPSDSPRQSPTVQAPPPLGASMMLAAADLGAGWTLEEPAPRANEVRFDPCGDGKLGPKPDQQRVRRFTSESGEVLQHAMAYQEADAKAAMRAIRSAVERCRTATPRGGASKVTYVDRGSLDAGDESLVLRVEGGPQDPITTYATVVRVGGLVMTLQDTRVGEPYSESAHKALARKAAARLPN